MKQFKLNTFFSLSFTALALSACGPQAYVPGTVQSNQDAAGTMNIPPKVDIVLGVGSDGTLQNVMGRLNPEIQNFAASLQASGWDYRFVAIPLDEAVTTSNYNITNAVSVSRYDGNYANTSGGWIPPYPGADPTNQSLKIDASLFRNADTFAIPSPPTTNLSAHEAGLRNQNNFLYNSIVQNKFLRPDALLAIITISTGDDHSAGYWGPAWNPLTGQYDHPTRTDWFPNPTQFNGLLSSLAQVKAVPSQIKYFSVVAQNTSYCNGSSVWNGLNYTQTSNSLNGKAIDICTNAIPDALNAIKNSLVASNVTFRKSYLVVNSDPSTQTITVTKISNGTSTVIPQDSTNGWSYEGYGTKYTVDAFKLVNDPTWYLYQAVQKTGYLIKLNGSAALIGSDTARVEYMNNGAVIAQ